MPTVPRYQGGVQRTPLQIPRESPNAPSDAFGVRGPNILEGAVSNLAQIVQVHKQKADQVASVEFNTGLAALESRILYDSKTGVLNRRGKDALDAPEAADEAWQAGVSELEAKLSNKTQRIAFAGAKAERKVGLDTSIQRHVAEQLRINDAEATDAFLTTERGAALSSYQDADRVELGVDRQVAAIRDFAKRNGMSDEKMQERILEASSKTYAGVIDRMLTNEQDQKASEYYKQVKEYVTGDDQVRIEKALEEGTLRGESQRKADAIMAKHPDDAKAALDEAKQIKDAKVRDATEQRVRQSIQDARSIKNEEQEDLYLRATNIMEKRPGEKPGDAIPPSMWTQLTLPMRNALENRYENMNNDDQKWLTFLELSPQDVANLNKAQFESGYWSHFDKEHRTRAEGLWNSARDAMANKDSAVSNLHLASTLTFKDRLSNTLRQANVIPPDLSPAKFNKQQATIYAGFEQEAAREIEHFELTKYHGKREATGEEMQQIIDQMVIKRVFVKDAGFMFFDKEKTAFGLTTDEQGKAYVPIDRVPPSEVESIKNIMRSRNITITNSRIERLFAATLMNNRPLFEQILGEK